MEVFLRFLQHFRCYVRLLSAICPGSVTLSSAACRTVAGLLQKSDTRKNCKHNTGMQYVQYMTPVRKRYVNTHKITALPGKNHGVFWKKQQKEKQESGGKCSAARAFHTATLLRSKENILKSQCEICLICSLQILALLRCKTPTK